MSSMFIEAGEPATGQKVMLATTVYEDPAAAYTFSISRSRESLHKAGIGTAYILLSGNCHVDDSRNSVVQEFLLSDCTDLVFLDADVVWEPEALIALCRFDVDLVGGIYPYRRDDEMSKKSMPVITIPGVTNAEAGLLQVAGLPTGFMKIKRHVLETLAEDAKKHWPKHDRRAMIPIIFERTFDPTPDDPMIGARWGGDLSFCRKWHDKGGKMYAAVDLHLGHVTKSVIWDSLGAALRRQDDSTLQYLVERLKAGDYAPQLFAEARRAIGNHFGALEDVLTLCAVMGMKADGPIIETGTGLTSIVLAASSKHKVYSLEHDPKWYEEVKGMISKSGVENIEVRLCKIKDGWYEVPDDLPKAFALGLNDGPPRTVGSRMGFFKHFGNTKNIICDDADDKGYGDALMAWSKENGRRIDFVERSAIIR